MTDVPFHLRLAEAMARKGQTPSTLAAATPLKERSIYRWLAGGSVPGLEALPILCRALDTTADYLIGLTP